MPETRVAAASMRGLRFQAAPHVHTVPIDSPFDGIDDFKGDEVFGGLPLAVDECLVAQERRVMQHVFHG